MFTLIAVFLLLITMSVALVSIVGLKFFDNIDQDAIQRDEEARRDAHGDDHELVDGYCSVCDFQVLREDELTDSQI